MPSNMDENVRDSALRRDVAAAGASEQNEASPGYETRDANTFGVLGFLVVLATVIVAVLLLTWGLFWQFGASERNRATASPFSNVRELPTGPLLQVTPREDLQQTLARQQSKLDTYGWENRQAGTVRIPIERAMELLLQRGLPATNAADANESKGLPRKARLRGEASGTRKTPVPAKGN